ncbi:LysR family transcriptional regulator [Ruania zhangjianzhongii]|uniref:LysR family transcriptional regulator n=1 Tax=Ruania zhangjianzhongii TaxID=2603206 RepID=UPI0011C91960|nr:LysR family transcriptional regulator [Ruania zhangjianzhongii]
MELHQLRYFLAVADTGSFTAAAGAVRVSQSGISTQVQKLERELGLSLIDRSARRISLTPAGERLVPFARGAVSAVEDVSGAAADIRGLVTGSLSVATVTGLAWPGLFDALATLHAQHPGIDIRLREGTSQDLIEQVREGSADVAIAAWSDVEPAGLRSCVVFDDALVAVVARGHPWAARSGLRAIDLAHADLITLPRGTGARAALETLMTGVGSTVEPRWEVTTPTFVQMLTTRGLGVGIVSATTAEQWDGVVAVQVCDGRARSRLGIVWRDRPSHAARALVDELEQRGTAQM